jgi:GxxExxY protein
MASVVTLRPIRVNEITRSIIGAAMKVHSALGSGLLESAYEACLLFELHDAGLKAESQVPLPVIYKQVRINLGYRLDLLVEDSVIIELKCVDAVNPVHEAQLLSYLKSSGKHIGLIINFNVPRLKDGIKRIVNGTGWE